MGKDIGAKQQWGVRPCDRKEPGALKELVARPMAMAMKRVFVFV